MKSIKHDKASRQALYAIYEHNVCDLPSVFLAAFQTLIFQLYQQEQFCTGYWVNETGMWSEEEDPLRIVPICAALHYDLAFPELLQNVKKSLTPASRKEMLLPTGQVSET